MVDSIVGSEFDSADAVVIGVPYEQSASFGSGAENGPSAIIDVLDHYLEFFDRYTRTVPANAYRFGAKILDQVKGLPPEKMISEVRDIIKSENRFFVLLGGVHSVTIGALQALAEKFRPNEVTVVQIDAHFDLRNDDSDYNDIDPGPYAHSTVMRRAHELGFKLLPIGIRTMAEQEYLYTQENNISFFEWGRLDIPTPSIGEILAGISTEYVYLTVDVDGFDPAVMPGTGTPVPGGLAWEFGESLIRTILTEKRVIGADIVEVSPITGSGATEYNAAQLAYHMLALGVTQKHES